MAAAGLERRLPMTQTFTVNGMTCGHCVPSVTKELTKIDGVREVSVDLDAHQVSVEAEGELDADRVAAAVSEAGFELVR